MSHCNYPQSNILYSSELIPQHAICPFIISAPLITYFNILTLISISIVSMDIFKRMQEILFEKMHQIQQGKMQSRLGFIIALTIKLLFKEVLLIWLYLLPIPFIQQFRTFLITNMTLYNLPITLSILIFLVSFLSLYIPSSIINNAKLLMVVQALIPWLDIFSLGVTTICIRLAIVNSGGNVALGICNIVSVIIVCLIQILYNLFNFTKSPRTSNYFQRRQARFVAASSLLLMCLCIYLSVKSASSSDILSSGQLIIYSIIHFILCAIKTKERIYMKFFLNTLSQSISAFFFFLQFNFCVVVVFNNAFNMSFITNNLLFLLIIMTGLGYSSLYAYISRRNGNMFLSSASELKNQDQAILYLDCLCELATKVQNQEEDIILISLKKKHCLACANAACFCQTTKQLSTFIQQYVKCELTQMTQIFHNSPNILISILYFKMVMFEYYPQILARLNYYATHFSLSLTQRFYRYCLSQYVINFIRKRNFQINAVDSQHMFKLQQIRIEIESIIKGEIDVRGKKWKYLSRGLCRISQLQHNCNISLEYIKRMMTIYNDNKIKFRKSKEFNLLLLFYFTKVSFLNNGREIRQNLKEIYYGYKEDQLYSLKEFKKFIYHKRSCVFQTLIDTKSMAIITTVSRNVQEMFGFPSNKIVGTSINTLMPEFMAEQHEKIMSDWAKSGTWRTIGKLKQIYCVHKQQYCFSALIYLKIYIKDNSLHFITNIFKLNDSDYLVLNPNMKIQGLGRKFLKILGEPAKRINLQLLIQNNNNMLSGQNYVQDKIYRKVFLSLKNMQSEVDNYLQTLNVKFQQNQRLQTNLQFHKQIMQSCEEKYFVQFTVKKYKMGNIGFIVINLRESKKIQQHQTLTFINRPPSYLPNDNSKDQIELQMASSKRSSESKDQNNNNDQIIIQQNANSSLTSMTQKQNYPLSKTIDKFLILLQSPEEIRDSRMNKYNTIIIIMLLFLSVIDFISFYSYRITLFQIKGIFFADGAVSDIMQTTEIAYNQLYVLRSQVLNGTVIDFNSTLQSAQLIQSYVYKLRENSFSSVITNVTELTKQRMYSYIQKPAQWKMGNNTIQIQTHQFLQQFYYLTGQVVQELKTLKLPGKNLTSIVDSEYLKLLFLNFPEMQRLNEFYLNDYQQIGNSSHDILNYLSIISLLFYVLVSSGLALAINHYFKYRFNQVVDSFNYFSYIPNHFLQKMKDYYTLLTTSIIQTDKLKNIDINEDEVFAVDTYDLFHKNTESTRNTLSSKIRFINYENYYKWIFIIAFLVVANGLNYLATLQIRNFFETSKTVIEQINMLMRSQNKLLQSYFDLKSTYYLSGGKYFDANLYSKLDTYMNQSQVQWNAVSDQLTIIFKNYDPDYQANFVDTLVKSVCQLSAPDLTPFQNKKCLKQLTLNILDGGILIAMNYFQRNVRQAMQDLRNQYILKKKAIYKGDYFQQLNYVELDKMLIYMFKIYQLTQSVTYNAYDNVIYKITASYLQITVGITAFFIIVLLVWLKSIPGQKRELSMLYGHLLLVPFMILKTNNRIANNLKEVIEYSDS